MAARSLKRACKNPFTRGRPPTNKEVITLLAATSRSSATQLDDHLRPAVLADADNGKDVHDRRYLHAGGSAAARRVHVGGRARMRLSRSAGGAGAINLRALRKADI